MSSIQIRAIGAKTTLMVQAAPAATELPHAFVCVKSELVTMLDTVSAALPGFDSVTDWAGLAVPTVWLPNVRLVGEAAAAGVPGVGVGVTVGVGVALLPLPPQAT